jgi:glycerate kinase
MKKKLNILIIPDSFKGSISASDIAKIICTKLEESNLLLSITSLPLADGGEGSLEALQQSKNFRSVKLSVSNPLFDKIEAEYLFDKKNNTAYIELAKASGLQLVKGNPDIMNSNTFGTGQLIGHAIENGGKKIFLFIGGSATNDAGIGIMEALGYRFYNNKGDVLKPIPLNLEKIFRIDGSESILKTNDVEILVASDVTNPFYGANGAAFVYAPQKGAKPSEVKQLDAGLRHFARLVFDRYNIDLQTIEGAGAAGGVGGGLFAFAEAKMASGAELIFNMLNVEDKIKAADIIISGEGKIDNQSMNNKLLCSISKLTQKHKKQLWAVCGYFDGDKKLKENLALTKVFALQKQTKRFRKPYLMLKTDFQWWPMIL